MHNPVRIFLLAVIVVVLIESFFLHHETRVNAANPHIAGVLACTTPPPGMIAWWPGEGDANDIRGENNGTLQNGTTFMPGEVGQSFSFDGIDDFVSVNNTGSMDFRTGDFSLDLWFNLNSFQNDQTLLHKVLGAFPNDQGYFLEFDSAASSGNGQISLRFVVRQGSGNSNDLIVAVPSIQTERRSHNA